MVDVYSPASVSCIQSKYMKTWDKLFKNGPSKSCGRRPLKSLKLQVCLDHFTSNFSKAGFHEFYLVYSQIPCRKSFSLGRFIYFIASNTGFVLDISQ